MPQFILKITMGNDAMKTSDDVVKSLLASATRISETFETSGRIWDDNGNVVGRYEIK